MLITQKIRGVRCREVVCLDWSRFLTTLQTLLVQEPDYIKLTEELDVVIDGYVAMKLQMPGLRVEHGILTIRDSNGGLIPCSRPHGSVSYGTPVNEAMLESEKYWRTVTCVYIPIVANTPPPTVVCRVYEILVVEGTLADFPVMLNNVELALLRGACDANREPLEPDHALQKQLMDTSVTLDGVTDVVVSGDIYHSGTRYQYDLIIEPGVRYTQYNGSAYAIQTATDNTPECQIQLTELPLNLLCSVKTLASMQRSNVEVAGSVEAAITELVEAKTPSRATQHIRKCMAEVALDELSTPLTPERVSATLVSILDQEVHNRINTR
jgi:hypothetical protein